MPWILPKLSLHTSSWMMCKFSWHQSYINSWLGHYHHDVVPSLLTWICHILVGSFFEHVIFWLVHSWNMSFFWRTISFWHQPLYHYLHIGGCQPPSAGSLDPFLRGMKCILFRGCDSLITPLSMFQFKSILTWSILSQGKGKLPLVALAPQIVQEVFKNVVLTFLCLFFHLLYHVGYRLYHL